MALTRGNILDRVEAITGQDSDEFRTYLEISFNQVLNELFDIHDWEWTHKADQFTTTPATEEYDLSDSMLVSGDGDIRSARHIECMWDSTNGRPILPAELREIRKHFPLNDNPGQPSRYAPWGNYKIILTDIPDEAIVVKFLYKSKAIESTSDSDDLEDDLGVPSFVHQIVTKKMIAEGFMYFDDTRYQAVINEVGTPRIVNSLVFNAIAADMQHLESGTRFKFWEEELGSSGVTFNDFLRRTWATTDY
jgi:hypothetical protein